MTNTVKMPRQHNRRLKEIQRQQDYIEGVKELALTLGFMFFLVMCLWGATEGYDWLCTVTAENARLKVESNEEHAAFKSTFNQDAEKKRRDDAERQMLVKAWQKQNPQLAGIFNAK